MAEEQWIYTTKREMLITERKALSDALADAYKAMQGLISGEIQSYNLGHYSISRTKLAFLSSSFGNVVIFQHRFFI